MANLIANGEQLRLVRAKMNATLNPYASRAEFEAANIPTSVLMVYAIDGSDVYALIRDQSGDWSSGDGAKWTARIDGGLSSELLTEAVNATAADRTQTGLDRAAAASAAAAAALASGDWEAFASREDLVSAIASDGASAGKQYMTNGITLWAPSIGHPDYGSNAIPDLPGLAPSGDVLDIKMCGSSSDLANDFKGIMEQAAEDCLARNWKLNVSRGPWETQPIIIDAAMDGLLHIDFAPGSTLIGPAKWQHFAGDGVTKNFTLTAWGSAITDNCVAAIVYADGSYTVLVSGDATNGFVKSGTTITLGSSVAAPPVGATLTTSATASLFAVRGEGRKFGVRFRGGDFYNGDMGYVEQQGSGSAVVMQTLRDVYWDGAPVFRGHPDHTFNAGILNKRGDSGLVVLDVERGNFYGAQFLYQPDIGNYTSGLARGTPPEDYHLDDGRFINFFGAQAYMCGTAFRSARDGGAYGMYGCGADLCSDGFLAADVSSNDLPSARNIVVDGFTCRKIARNVLDLREMKSVNIRNLMIEDWGRLPDGTVPTTFFPMFNLAGSTDYMRIDARMRYEEWEPPSTASTFVVMANASFRDTKINLSIDLPESAIGAGHTAVLATGAIGSTGLIDLDLNLTNVDNDLNVPTNKVVRAKVAHVTRTTGGTTITRYRQHNGNITPEPEGLVVSTDTGFGVGVASPQQRMHVAGIARFERPGIPAQAIHVSPDVSQRITGYSDPANAKPLMINVSTNTSNTAPTGGSVSLDLATMGVPKARLTQAGDFGIGTSALTPTTKLHVDGPIRHQTYTVATLPSASAVGAGTIATVTDASNTPAAGNVVASGGTRTAMVESNDTAWIEGGVAPRKMRATAGTAADPSISFDGDENTGIFSPGADQLGITTGGVQRALLTSSLLNVNVQSHLQGRAFVTRPDVTSPVDENYVLQVQAIGDSHIKIQAGATSSAYFGMGTTSDALNAGLSLSNVTGLLNIRAGNANRISVLSAGDVGIGTSVPTTKLHVDGPVRTKVYTVATLPSASAVGAGTRSAVTDANATTFNSVVAGGGANFVPVISNGTNWLIG